MISIKIRIGEAMRRLLVLFLLLSLLASVVSVTSAEDTGWWDDDYNYRVNIVPAYGTSPCSATLDMGELLDELGVVPAGGGTQWMADPASMHAVAGGSEVDIDWDPADGLVVEDFESSLGPWTISGDIDAVLTGDVGSSTSIRFTKSSTAGVKLYTTVGSDALAGKDYLMLDGRGRFRITVRDPAKGTFMLDDEVTSDSFGRAVFPLSDDAYREGATFYIEIYPLDTYTMNWADDITLFDDTLSVTCGPSTDDLYVYFNTYVTGTDAQSAELHAFSADPVDASVGEAEGFRVTFERTFSEPIRGTEEIVVNVADARNDIEWVRFRIDWPSWVSFSDEEYGVWGELTRDGATWSASWDTLRTVCDGHHTLAVMARDSEGNTVYQTTEVVVENITEDVDLASGETSFSFAMIGDTQPGAGNEPNPLVATHIMELVASEDIDFIVQVGDLTYAGNPLEYVHVREQITTYANVPFYPVVGNHDAVDAEGLELFEHYFGHITYAFDYGNSRFIFLCSELSGQQGRITGNQLNWLDDELRTNADKDHIFISVHQPIYPVFHGLDNTAEVQEVIERYDNVTAIFQGHEHTYNHEMVAGMDIFVTGGATWLDSQYEEDATFNHYFVMHVDGDDYTWEVRKTSHIYVDSPQDGMETAGSEITVTGTTQPYTTVDVNGVTTESNARGAYEASVPLDYGENEITVSTTGLPDGEPHEVKRTVVRLSPLEIAPVGEATGDEPLTVKVTSQGNPVSGATVQAHTATATTDASGMATLSSYPEEQFKLSAYGEGYEGTYTMVDVTSGSGSMTMYAGLAIVVIVVVIVGLQMRKKR
jgi:hypothetical protein